MKNGIGFAAHPKKTLYEVFKVFKIRAFESEKIQLKIIIILFLKTLIHP